MKKFITILALLVFAAQISTAQDKTIEKRVTTNSKDAFTSYDGNVPAVRFDIGYAW